MYTTCNLRTIVYRCQYKDINNDKMIEYVQNIINLKIVLGHTKVLLKVYIPKFIEIDFTETFVLIILDIQYWRCVFYACLRYLQFSPLRHINEEKNIPK